MTYAKLKSRLKNLSYFLSLNEKDAFGRKWKYRTSPMGAGSTNYFNSLEEINRYCENIEKIRKWQEEVLTTLSE